MSTRLGIVGGGQPGLYLCKAAQGLGVNVTVIAESADDAALRYVDRAVVGSLDSASAIEQFLGGCDVITFDKEAVPNETLGWLIDAQAQGRIAIHPGAAR